MVDTIENSRENNNLQKLLALFDADGIMPTIETKQEIPDMWYLRDKDGFAKAVLDAYVVQDIMAGGAGEFQERKLDSGEYVMVYRITMEDVSISFKGCLLFVHAGDYLRRG